MRFDELRSRSLLRAQIESLIEEEKEKSMERFIVTNADRTSFITHADYTRTTSEMEYAALFRTFERAQGALDVLENTNSSATNFEVCRIEFVTCDPFCFEEP